MHASLTSDWEGSFIGSACSLITGFNSLADRRKAGELPETQIPKGKSNTQGQIQDLQPEAYTI